VADNVRIESLFSGLILRVAAPGEREKVLQFRSVIYQEELGDPGIDRYDPSANHLIACDSGDQIVAALRVVGPEQRPFDLEQLFDLNPLLKTGSAPAEVSRFCIAKAHRHINRTEMVHVAMLKLVHAFSIKQRLTDLFTLGLPHLKNLYRVGFFSQLDVACQHPVWGRTVLMHLDLEAVRRRYQDSNNRMARLLFRTHLPNIFV